MCFLFGRGASAHCSQQATFPRSMRASYWSSAPRLCFLRRNRSDGRILVASPCFSNRKEDIENVHAELKLLSGVAARSGLKRFAPNEFFSSNDVGEHEVDLMPKHFSRKMPGMRQIHQRGGPHRERGSPVLLCVFSGDYMQENLQESLKSQYFRERSDEQL